MKIVIITPVRNEEKYISTTIKCMLEQTLRPVEWIIVNDGSTDNTEKEINRFLYKSSFIRLVSIKNRGYRKPAKGVIETFYQGFKKVESNDYDILAKFDGDLKFPPDMLEKISYAFRNDEKLGITGGVRYERKSKNGPFRKVLVPKGFVGGPFKFYRKMCFDDIGGLIKRAGWDGVDTIKAQMNGWATGEIDSLKIIHLKPTGTSKGEGLIKAWEKYGDVSYYMGGYIWYFLLRVFLRSLEGRSPRVGYYMINGYLKSKSANENRETSEFRNFLKKKQRQNISYWINLASKFLVN